MLDFSYLIKCYKIKEIWNSTSMFTYSWDVSRKMPTFTTFSKEFPLSELHLILRAKCSNFWRIVSWFAGQNHLRSYELVEWENCLKCVRVNLACWFFITINLSCCFKSNLIREFHMKPKIFRLKCVMVLTHEQMLNV